MHLQLEFTYLAFQCPNHSASFFGLLFEPVDIHERDHKFFAQIEQYIKVLFGIHFLGKAIAEFEYADRRGSFFPDSQDYMEQILWTKLFIV